MTVRTFTRSEVMTHNNKENGVWLIIHGKVYDVTKFLAEVSFKLKIR